MQDTAVNFICARCTSRFSNDGICPDCNISLVPLSTTACEDCGAELKPDAKFCSHCGRVLQSKCENCGTILSSEDIFCPDCGKKNNDSATELPEAKTRNEECCSASGEELVELMYSPVNLRDFHNNYSFLSTGPDSEEYNLAIERGLKVAKDKPVIMRFGSYPRRWAIQKPGYFRRLITMLIDVPLWGAFCFLILAAVIGSHEGGGLIRALGISSEAPRGIFALIWVPLSYFVYTAGAEILFGTTPGGLLGGTRVVNEYGNRLTAWQVIKRQFSRLITPLLVITGGAGDHEIVVR